MKKQILTFFLLSNFLFSQNTTVYENAFEAGVGTEWSVVQTILANNTTTLGNFGNETTTLNLNNLPTHENITINFDLYLFTTWDGNAGGINGPDYWLMSLDGLTIFEETFANTGWLGSTQTYPGGGDSPAQTGATIGYYHNASTQIESPDGTGGCNPPCSSMYQMSITVPHTEASATISFFANMVCSTNPSDDNIPYDESWAIDNVQVFVDMPAVSGCTNITACNYNPNATEDDGSCEFIEQVSISGEIETCEESILLESIGGPYDSYQWYLDGDIINNENQTSLLVNQTGTYKVEVENGTPENNHSIFFDGQGGHIDLPTVNFNASQDFTISFWLKTQSNNHQTIINTIPHTILGIGINPVPSQDPFGVGGDIIMNFGDGLDASGSWINGAEDNLQNSFTDPSDPIIINEWAHITVKKEQNQWTIYQNAIEIGGVYSETQPGNVDAQLIFGTDSSPIAFEHFFGNIDQLQIWNTALTIEEINNFMNCPPTGSEQGLTNYWSLEEEGVAQIFDMANSTYNGGFVNMNTAESWSTETPTLNCSTCLSSEEINITINNCGCTDFSADNFDATASVDDGSCEYLGCTDPGACNYNLIATIDDGSCEYLDINLGEDVTTCESVVTLNAGEGFDNYEWSTGEITQTIDVTETGPYSVSVNNFGENNNFEIGSFYEGGVIFYIENNIAYIVTENILASGVSCDGNGVNTPWGCSGQLVGALGEGLGDGYQNTLNIISSGCADSTSPAFICYNYNNGFDDWYLPSIGELDLIYQNLFLTNSMNYDTCDPNNWYRSSTECNENTVKDFNFGGGNAGMGMDNCNTKSDWQGGVLAIRSVDLFNPITCSDSDDIFVTINNCGCTDPVADNFSSTANLDDGSCEYWGCMDSSADNFDPTANLDDGSCEYLGCTDPTADNFDSTANVDDGTCEYLGCTDSSADNFDSTANVDDGTCEYLGCTDSSADNFNPTATVDDGTCEYLGCIDLGACNYNNVANVDDGSCEYDTCAGCTDPNADNYNPEATVDSGNCSYLGCTDPGADNFDSTANEDDGTCEYLGCIDSSADNFDSTANVDDGSCEYLGCTDLNACNFDSTANVDDGSCQLCASREFNDGSYLDVDSEIINAQGITISFWVNDNDFCANPEDFATYIDFGSQDTYRYVVRNRSCKIEAFFEGDMLPTEFDWGTMDWGYPKASAAGGIGPQSGWRQITTVFCPTTIRVYVDGNIVASNGTGVYFQEGFNLFADDIKRIGSNQVDYEPANAMIDEVRIWNRALSGEEVLARAGGVTTLNMDEEINLNGYWQMDCANPFLNQVTGQLGSDNLSVVNENFNGNSCETSSEYDYECSLDFEGNPDCNSCDPPEGCTDEEACNYDYLAVISIPSACFYIADYCPDLEYPEYYDCDCKCINDSDSDDVCDELELDGCSEDENACNYNPDGTEPCEYPIDIYDVDYVDCDGNCLNDIDGDGVCDEDDNCVDVYNPNQEDLNNDGIGDDCDGVGLEELGETKKIIKVTDVLGREIQKEIKGSTLMYWYNTGEVDIKYIF